MNATSRELVEIEKAQNAKCGENFSSEMVDLDIVTEGIALPSLRVILVLSNLYKDPKSAVTVVDYLPLSIDVMEYRELERALRANGFRPAYQMGKLINLERYNAQYVAMAAECSLHYAVEQTVTANVNDLKTNTTVFGYVEVVLDDKLRVMPDGKMNKNSQELIVPRTMLKEWHVYGMGLGQADFSVAMVSAVKIFMDKVISGNHDQKTFTSVRGTASSLDYKVMIKRKLGLEDLVFARMPTKKPRLADFDKDTRPATPKPIRATPDQPILVGDDDELKTEDEFEEIPQIDAKRSPTSSPASATRFKKRQRLDEGDELADFGFLLEDEPEQETVNFGVAPGTRGLLLQPSNTFAIPGIRKEDCIAQQVTDKELIG